MIAIAVPAVTSPAVNLPRESDTDTAAPVQKRRTYRGTKYQSYAEIARNVYGVNDGNEMYRLGLAQFGNTSQSTGPAM